MAEDIGGDKNLPPTPRKIQRAREEGNIARSQDLNSAWALGVALIAFLVMLPWMFGYSLESFRYFIGNAHLLIEPETPMPLVMRDVLLYLAIIMLPFFVVMLVTGTFMSIVQVGFLWTGKPLAPKLSRMNPIAGFKRLFSLRALVDLIKAIIKFAIVVTVLYVAFQDRLDEFVMLMLLPPDELVGVTMSFIFSMWWRVVAAMAVLGGLDYGYQRWQHLRDLRMSPKEVQQEAKEMEGDPQIKRRIRQLQRQMAQRRMMGAVPTADVIVTNPTEFAVALRYDMQSMPAPTVVAKGRRLQAQRIRDLGAEHSVPIVQRRELARALYAEVEIDQAVPENLFRAVAEVLSFVYQIDRRAEKVRERSGLLGGNGA